MLWVNYVPPTGLCEYCALIKKVYDIKCFYLIGLGWVGLFFYGKSTIIGYLMPNPVYTYILNIYDL